MQSLITDNLHYQDIKAYKYRVKDITQEIYFLNKDLIKALEPYNVIVHKYFQIQHDRVLVYNNYTWDGASKVLFNTKNLIIPSLVHDILCQAIALGYIDRDIRKEADKEYYLQSRKSGVNVIRVALHYIGIRTWANLVKTKLKTITQYDTIHSVNI